MRFSDYNLNFIFGHSNSLRTAATFLALPLLLILFPPISSLPANGQTSLPSATARPKIRTISTRLAGFGVPFKVDSKDQSFIEVHLYVSADQGKSWQFHDRQATHAEEFPFQAKGDGEYWFALRTLSRDRKLLPEGKIGPELKIVVDTVKPKLDFRIETDPAGRVICRWRAEDPNIDPRSLRIRYREDRTQFGDDDDTRGWQQVPIQLRYDVAAGIFSDQLAWWPDTAARNLKVQVSVSDAAGNVISLDRTVVVPQVAWRNRQSNSVNIATSKPRLNTQRAPLQNYQHPENTGQNTAQNTNHSSAGPPSKFAPSQVAANTTAGYGQPPNDAKPVKKSKPPNVVCENGVCRIVPQASTPPVQKTATPNVAANRTPAIKTSGNRLAQTQGESFQAANIRGAGHPNSNHNSVRPPARTANLSTAGSLRRLTVPLVGSSREFAAPPVPEKFKPYSQANHSRANHSQANPSRANPVYDDSIRVAQQPADWNYRGQTGAENALNHQGHQHQNHHPGGSIPWASRSQSQGPQSQSSSSTTLAPDSHILPEVMNLPRAQSATHPFGPGISSQSQAYPPHQPYPQANSIGHPRPTSNHPNQQFGSGNEFGNGSENGSDSVSTRRIEGNQVIAEGTTRRRTHSFHNSANQTGGSASFDRNQQPPTAHHPQTSQTESGFGMQPAPLNPTGRQLRPSNFQPRTHEQHQPSRRSGPRSNSLKLPFPTRAGMQPINTPRFRLNYNIDAIDPSGVERVTLWMTRDGGQSWNSWGTDPDNVSPFPVQVQESGLYGFRVAIKSRDGLQGRAPASGDDADMWVRVDLESPLAKITSAPYGRGDEAGNLVINYKVADPYLALRPIQLSYARNPQGPWTTIENGIRNNGRYLWRIGSEVPDRVFLRIQARDTAGNVATHVLPQALDISGLVPRGHINGVEPISPGR